MRVEKINENKVKIILTLEELENRKISLSDLENNSSLARELFLDLIEENNLDEDFKLNDSQLLIEATSDTENLFEITITKLDLNISNSANKYNDVKSSKKRKTIYKASSNIFIFNTMDMVLELASNLKNQDLFFGRNTLYRLDNKYFLIFSKSSIKNKNFMKTFAFINEYSSNSMFDPLFETSIKERADLIIKNNAIQKLILM